MYEGGCLCGSLRFRADDRPIDVNVGCMDDPFAFSPQYHVYSKDRIGWFDTADDLPRYAESEPGADEPGAG